MIIPKVTSLIMATEVTAHCISSNLSYDGQLANEDMYFLDEARPWTSLKFYVSIGQGVFLSLLCFDSDRNNYSSPG